MADCEVVKKNLTNKINRVYGQLGAIKKMIESDRDCIETVTQIAAVRSALAGIARDMLSEEAISCSKSPNKQKEFDRLLKALFSIT